ncbi:TolC family protein [sulfur-oxidizing endosymbiont of Gigantopelta aegis]|uniref:TolC family protein n=1 Tax=sulfur-oxidizing endosymbiont of Gigantopelta aegis TaxID=2794934 RepID=UPI0018DE77AA|nr:TolC family protein [sulfur-oxidizing endosymbiont of Gigantopelta aegis]
MKNNFFQSILTHTARPLSTLCISGLLILPFAQTALAAEMSKVSMSHSSQNENSNSSQWSKWVLTQVQSLPSIQAIETGTLVADEQRNASQQALYNPELGAFYTDNKDDEYGMILSQTIDWFDKRSANAQLGQVDYDLVMLDKVLQVEEKLSEALTAYIEYAMSEQLLAVSKDQEKLLTKLSNDLRLREAAGDVGQIDAEMAYLSLSQNLQQISLTEIRYRKARANLQQSLNSKALHYHPKTSIWVNEVPEAEIDSKVDSGLRVQLAKKQLEQSVSQSKIAQLNKKVNPTIGLGAGRDGNRNTVLLELSIPLNVRNTFSAEYSAALHRVNQTELELKEQQRLLKNNIEQSLINYKALKTRVLSWERLTGSRLKNTQKLLNKQWKSGDISTSDYLFALRQRTDTLIASIELNGEMHKAWVEWLLASSQVKKWLNSL